MYKAFTGFCKNLIKDYKKQEAIKIIQSKNITGIPNVQVVIKSRYDSSVICTYEIKDTGCARINLGKAVLKAIADKVCLVGADLTGVEIRGKNLSRLNLKATVLKYADLTGSNLTETDLSYAKLNDANLKYTLLGGANMKRADLSFALVEGAVFGGTNLSDTNLHCVSMRKAKTLNRGTREIYEYHARDNTE